jgi:glycosyltransferase involved in cell wall biosynthesis
MQRFENLPSVESIKNRYGIHTPYMVLMAATFSSHKDYDLFLKVAKLVTTTRDDITFLGAGASDKDDADFQRMLRLSAGSPRIIFRDRISEIEAVMNAADVGILFSNKAVHGEGISNSVIEFMSLKKPVVANDAGGTVEVVRHNKNGYLITKETPAEIATLITGLIDDPEKRSAFGEASKNMINEMFSLEKMGQSFEKVYDEVLRQSGGAN